MREVDHVWVGVGLLGSLLLGIALMPLRSLTPACNLAFAFLALTIIVAELGGRMAALVTALASATSLDFFLTEPYFRLTIARPDDLAAFLALAVCGLIAAAFGRRRGRWSEVARRAGDDLDIVRVLVWQLRGGAPLDETLETLRESFRLGALVLRGPDRARSGHRWSRQRAAAHSHDSTRPGQARARRGSRRQNTNRRQGSPPAGGGRTTAPSQRCRGGRPRPVGRRS